MDRKRLMENISDKKILFFGCPMDCDEKYDSLQEKLHMVHGPDEFDDPLDGVLDCLVPDLQLDLDMDKTQILGSLPIPSWLGPRPGFKDRSSITTENFISFIDNNGCKKMAELADQFVSDQILPNIPCMVGIDHSLTGGVYSALARQYGKENLSLIIVDSHTDAVPMSALAGAIQYDAEVNPSSVHDTNDPFLYNRPDSYNASSFVDNLITEKLVDPKNLYIIGVSDFPEKKSLRVKDKRIKNYTNVYMNLKRRGATIITKKECKLNPQKISGLLKKISTSHVYVSIDMDIGANNALEGVRFRNWKGLDQSKIYKIADAISKLFTDSIHLAGMDICEIDPRRAGSIGPLGKDLTYEIAAKLIKKIAFNR